MDKQIRESKEGIGELNKKLSEVSKNIYGNKLELRVVDPSNLILLKKNARFMKHEMFSQLVENIIRDGQLESVPLCYKLKDGSLEVISGNHRVQGAIKANIKLILVMVITEDLSVSRRRAKQLSHNQISGEDDFSLLKEIWNEIIEINDKIYTGMDSIKIEELEKIQFSALSTPSIKTESITLWFLPEEVVKIEELITYAEKFIASKKIFMVPLKIYDHVFKMLVEIKTKYDIRNNAVALLHIFEIAKNTIDQMKVIEESQKNMKNQEKV